MRRSIIAAVLAAGLTPHMALASECSDASERYSYAVDDVAYELNQYVRCINSSDGREDCSSEFRRLTSAQEGFESAVGEIQSYCEF